MCVIIWLLAFWRMFQAVSSMGHPNNRSFDRNSPQKRQIDTAFQQEIGSFKCYKRSDKSRF